MAGLSTVEIAGALLVPPTTVGQRISRAKQRIKAGGARFELPSPEKRAERITAVRDVLYLLFTEGVALVSAALATAPIGAFLRARDDEGLPSS